MAVVPIVRGFRVPEETNPLHAALNVFRSVARLAARIAREIAVRRDMRRLGEFNDHMLRDIGIVRADIEGAVRRGHDGSDDDPPRSGRSNRTDPHDLLEDRSALRKGVPAPIFTPRCAAIVAATSAKVSRRPTGPGATSGPKAIIGACSRV